MYQGVLISWSPDNSMQLTCSDKYNESVSLVYRLSGYLFRRVSRTAAFLVGCGFLAIQVQSTCVCIHDCVVTIVLSKGSYRILGLGEGEK